MRRRRGQGPHLAKRWEPRGFSRVAAAFSSYDGDLRLPGLVFCGGMELRLHLKLFKDNTTFRDVCGNCGFFGDARGRQYSFPNFEPVSCLMFSSNSSFLIHMQVSQGAGKLMWYSNLFKNFPNSTGTLRSESDPASRKSGAEP